MDASGSSSVGPIPWVRVDGMEGGRQPKPTEDISSSKSSLEIQKVLQLILSRLRERARPPTIFGQLASDTNRKSSIKVDVVVDSIRGAIRKTATLNQGVVEVDDDEASSGFSTTPTLDLMTQLRDCLILSHKQGWDALPTSSTSLHAMGFPSPRSPGPLSSPFKRRRSAAAVSQQGSVDHGIETSDMMQSCVSVLADVISEDCRYTILRPRLLAPRNALQAICLDVALAIVEAHPRPQTLAAVALAVTPAFHTFDPGLYPRLLAFFENGILRRMLQELQRAQSASDILSPAYEDYKPADMNALHVSPVVAIQVDRVPDEPFSLHPPFSPQSPSPWVRWSSPSASLNIVSSTAPFQSIEIYRLASAVSPLLASVLDTIDISTTSEHIAYRAGRIFGLIVDTKVDAYLDLLQVIAYHSSASRRGALSILSTFWPEAIGHVTASDSLPIAMYNPNTSPDLFDHQFVPWRFPASTKKPTSVSPGVTDHSYPVSCHSCGDSLYGFGLQCTLCPCAVHFTCYDPPDGSFLSQYPLASDPGTHRVTVTRFSRIQSSPRGKGHTPASYHQSSHDFHMINLFTLTTCLVCRMPLWGCSAQGVQCLQCRKFAHTSCLREGIPHCTSLPFTSTSIAIDWSDLRRSFVQHYRELLMTEDQILQRSHEDISIYYDVLWTQLQLLMNGVASGSIIVNQTNPTTGSAEENRVDEFELQYCVRIYHAYLSSGRNPKSNAMEEYQHSTKTPLDASILYDWPLLMYLAATAKSLSSPHEAGHFLTVQAENIGPIEASNHSAEIVSLAHIRDAFGTEFNVTADAAARYLMMHLHVVGLLRRVDHKEVLFGPNDQPPNRVYCTFPLPLLLDTSVHVETLVAAIEACLEDIHLSVNEMAFLLLTKKCWPNIWVSDYGLGRLAQAILSWVFTEAGRRFTDALISRDYISTGRPLPGMIPTSRTKPWPLAPSDRPGPAESSRSGGDYVACRRLLRNRFVIPWMRALHNLNEEAYAGTLFHHCRTRALEKTPGVFGDVFDSEGASANQTFSFELGDEILRLILRLCQSSIIFSCFDSVFVAWLDGSSGNEINKIVAYPSLPRLFNMEAETSRYSLRPDRQDSINSDVPDSWDVDPWRVITDAASAGDSGLRRALKWLEILARSGVAIPISTYMQMAAFIRDFDAPFYAYESLMECITATCWLKSFGAQDLLELIATIHERLAMWIQHTITAGENVTSICRFIRLSMASCLLLYGFGRETVVSLELIEGIEAKYLPTRRKTAGVGTIEPATLMLNVDLVNMLAQYVAFVPDELTTSIAIFLNALVSEASPLGSQGVDNFITINAHALNACAWQFYGIKLQRIAATRAALVLRLLVVDTRPLEAIIAEARKDGSPHEIRHAAVGRLFSIILDINSPHFQTEDRQWRPCVVPIVCQFFSTMWNESSEDIRLVVDVASQTLLPPHLEAISRCWDEYLLKSSFVERVQLVSFLLQLHPYFPAWKLLSWECIVDSMLENDFVSAHGGGDVDILTHMLSPYVIAAPTIQDDEVGLLRVLLISLSLQLIAGGIAVDLYTAVNIKHHLVKVLSFSGCKLVQTSNGTVHVSFDTIRTIPSISLPCVNGILRVMDGPVMLDLLPSAMGVFLPSETSSSTRVGGVFADVVLAVINTLDISKMPYVMARTWLEVLIVFILKYDIESIALRHLAAPLVEAVKRLTDFIQLDLSFDLRQLALSASHALLKTRPNLSAKILSRQIFAIASLVSDLGSKPEHALVAQGKAFLQAAFLRFASYGLFKSLFKRDPLPDGFFEVLRILMKESVRNAESDEHPDGALQDIVVRTTLIKMFDVRDGEDDQSLLATFGPISRNLNIFVERIHHTNYSVHLIQDVSLALTNIARRTAEWPADAFDPNPFLMMASTIVRYNKARSRDILLHIETLLRASLARFNVDSATLDMLLRVTSALYRRASTIKFDFPPNHIALAVLEILGEEYRGKAKSTPSTFAAMAQVFPPELDRELPVFSPDLLLSTAAHALFFLESPPFIARYTDTHFEISIHAAHLVLLASSRSRDVIDKTISAASGRSNVPLRIWNALALASLETPRFAPMLLAYVPSFSVSYTNALHMLEGQDIIPDTSSAATAAAASLSNAYAAIKLWMLLAEQCVMLKPRKAPTTDDGTQGNDEIRQVWNEVWPAFENVIVSSIMSTDSPIGTIVWGSYVDLVMFLLTSGSIVSLETSISHMALLERLCSTVNSDSNVQRFSRALHALQHPPPRVPYAQLLEKAKGDFKASEKLANAFNINTPKDIGSERKRDATDRRRENRTV